MENNIEELKKKRKEIDELIEKLESEPKYIEGACYKCWSSFYDKEPRIRKYKNGYMYDGDVLCLKTESYHKIVPLHTTPKLGLWVARDENGGLYIHEEKPYRFGNYKEWKNTQQWVEINKDLFPHLTWEDNPIEV